MKRWVIHNTKAVDTFEGRPLAYYSGMGETWTTIEAARRYLFRFCAEAIIRQLQAIPNRPHWRLVVEKA